MNNISKKKEQKKYDQQIYANSLLNNNEKIETFLEAINVFLVFEINDSTSNLPGRKINLLNKLDVHPS